jgi:hypothetical protein
MADNGNQGAFKAAMKGSPKSNYRLHKNMSWKSQYPAGSGAGIVAASIGDGAAKTPHDPYVFKYNGKK